MRGPRLSLENPLKQEEARLSISGKQKSSPPNSDFRLHSYLHDLAGDPKRSRPKQTFAKSIDEGATLKRVLYSTILRAGGSFSDVDARFFEEQTWALIQISKSHALLDVAGN